MRWAVLNPNFLSGDMMSRETEAALAESQQKQIQGGL